MTKKTANDIMIELQQNRTIIMDHWEELAITNQDDMDHLYSMILLVLGAQRLALRDLARAFKEEQDDA